MTFKMDCTQIFSRTATDSTGKKVIVDEIWFQPSADETQFFAGSDSRTILYMVHGTHTYEMLQTYTMTI